MGQNLAPPVRQKRDESLMSSAWQRYKKLSPAEQRMFLRAALLLPAAAWALRFVGFRRIERLIGSRERPHAPNTTGDAAKKWRVASAARRMTEAASRHGFMRGNCLSKSIILWHLLRREGLEPVLCVGGRKEDGRFEAHAWIELDGSAVNDSEDVRQRFAPFGGELRTALSEEK
jgi:hypothetical protein